MAYVDGFVIPIKKKNLRAYAKMAKIGGKTWMKNGALEYYECIGEELKVKTDPTKPKKSSPFGKKFNLRQSDTVIFSWIVFKSKVHRNKVNAKVMKEMELAMKDFNMKDMPFDMKKVLYAGFRPIVRMKN
ncbi:MAG TPA: DUF1428 domain-containing protein [archaeon]|nr:DUF1428 domain-containing protein [archaeon]